VDPGGDSVLQKSKITSGSCLAGVWGCYLGSQFEEAELERLWAISQQTLGLIKKHTDSSTREKSSRVAAQEESGIATQDILSEKQRAKDSRRYLGGVSGGFRRRQCPPKQKNYLR